MKWNQLWAASLAALLALLVSWDNRPVSADSSPTTSTSMVELWRDIPHHAPSGMGANVRADRLFPGDIFTDHLVVKNFTGEVLPSIVAISYWSTPTLNFVTWRGDDWTIESTPDPARYIARFSPTGGVVPNQIGELAVTFEVKQASVWPQQVYSPQAAHTLDTVLLPERGRVDRELLSDLFPVDAQRAYGWETGPQFSFHRANKDGTGSRPILTANLPSGYQVQSYDQDLESTQSFWNTTGRSCETRVTPDIRTGEVHLYQGNCNTIFNSASAMDVSSRRLTERIFGFLAGPPFINGAYNIQTDSKGDLQVVLQFDTVGKSLVDVHIPAGHALELSLTQFVTSVGPRELVLSFWKAPEGWVYASGRIAATNLHTLTVVDRTAIYNEHR